MEGIRLILGNGTVIENGRAGYASGFLWLHLPGWTMQQAAAAAFDPSAFGNITFQYGEMEDTYTGFTVCTNIMQDEDEITVCMVKG